MVTAGPADAATGAAQRFRQALTRLQTAPAFNRAPHRARVLDIAARLLRSADGPATALATMPDLLASGLLEAGDYAQPARLQAGMVPNTLDLADEPTATLECLNLLRMLAVAEGAVWCQGLPADQARRYLRMVLALTLDHLFDATSEATRTHSRRQRMTRTVLRFVADRIGYGTLLEQLVEEIWRLLRQRPLSVDAVRRMVTQLSLHCYGAHEEQVTVPHGAERLISALYGPSEGCREDPGLEVYADRAAHFDEDRWNEESASFARALRDTGLASPYHAVLLRAQLHIAPESIGQSLGLSATGMDSLRTHRRLIHTIIDRAVHPETCQCLYGLAVLLDSGTLRVPGVAASLQRMLTLPMARSVGARLTHALGPGVPPMAHLIAGTVGVLGQPLGVGQGDNPTCQAARAISFWASADPVYLLQLLAWAIRDDTILMTFHGRELSSAALPPGGAGEIGHDLDPVSLVLSPHLDRIYAEMCRLAFVPGEDPHRQVNPEFHGWRVGRGFAIAVDVGSGRLIDYADFVRRCFACFHPDYNGGRALIHPHPMGVAVTDALGRFVGFHAVTLLRVDSDGDGVVRAYFFNPNNDGGQDWGDDSKVSTYGRGERAGESSLPFVEFVSRLYLIHYDPLDLSHPGTVPEATVRAVMQRGQRTWAQDRLPPPGPADA